MGNIRILFNHNKVLKRAILQKLTALKINFNFIYLIDNNNFLCSLKYEQLIKTNGIPINSKRLRYKFDLTIFFF
jgi:hypothetical protein